MNNILFTIAIPAYKSLYLKECITSILSQTYSNYEVVIVDDASPENLEAIVSQFSDERIRFYRNEKNCGALNVVDNWNICLSYAKGDYIICMGDDDKLLPNCLQEYVRLIEQYPNRHIYHARTEIINERSEFYMIQEPRPIEESVYSMIWNRWHGRIQYIGDFLYEVKTLRVNGGFFKLPLAWGSDDISAFIAASERGIVNSQIPLFQYRVNSETISSTGNVKEKLNAISQEKDWYKSFLITKPINDQIDMVYWSMILNEIDKHFKQKRIVTIKTDIVYRSMSRYFYWLFNKQKFQLSVVDLVYILIEVIKRKYALKRYARA